MKNFKKYFDLDGSGEIDIGDLKRAGIIVSGAAAAAGVTAASSAYAASMIVSGKAMAFAAGVMKAAFWTGSAALSFSAFGAAKKVFALNKLVKDAKIVHYSGTSFMNVETAAALSDPATVAAAKKLAADGLGSTLVKKVIGKWVVGESLLGAAATIGKGYIAEFAIVRAVATKVALARGEIIIIGGIAFSPAAAIAAGLISVVVIGGITYYIYTGKKKRKVVVKTGKPQIDL